MLVRALCFTFLLVDSIHLSQSASHEGSSLDEISSLMMVFIVLHSGRGVSLIDPLLGTGCFVGDVGSLGINVNVTALNVCAIILKPSSSSSAMVSGPVVLITGSGTPIFMVF